jgi:hypothetical protein
MDIHIQRLVTVGTVTESAKSARGRHEAVFSLIGKDYQTVHWNEKHRGVSYQYNDGSADIKVFVEAEPNVDLSLPADDLTAE